MHPGIVEISPAARFEEAILNTFGLAPVARHRGSYPEHTSQPPSEGVGPWQERRG